MQALRTLCLIGFAFTVVNLLSGCDQKGEQPKKVAPEGLFTATAEALPEPYKYQVRLKWETDGTPQLWLLDRYEVGQREKVRETIVVDGKQSEFTDSEIESGKRYTYYLIAQGTFKFGLKAEVKIPRDMELKGEVRNPDLTGVNRLYLREGTKIVTEGSNLTIDVTELNVERGTIETFPLSQKAQPNSGGRSGGTITVKAVRAHGTLQIIGHGESGGAGMDGPNGRDGAQGPQGVPGVYELKPNEQLPMYCDAAERARLKAYYAGKAYNDPSARWDLWFFCSQQTGDGGTGARGEDGHDGMNGGKGGDSARVLVQIKTDSDLTVSVISEPGQGAIGGRGGNGGKGGPGGSPGVRDGGHLCRQAQNGAPGSDALAGRPGKFGDNGTRQPVCTQVGSKTTGDCPKE